MSECFNAPCGQLQKFCTWCQENRSYQITKESNDFAYTVKGDYGEIAELVIGEENGRISLTSLHASYDVEGTNGLLQIFLGDNPRPSWSGRTMGGHLTISFPHSLKGNPGEKITLKLSGRGGIQGIISVTGFWEISRGET